MDFNVGDIVSRDSYNNDIVFKIIRIDNDIAYLKGLHVRLCADSKIIDLKKEDNVNDDFDVDLNQMRTSDDYFYLPGKILHIDGDSEYLEKCLKFYKANKVYAIGKKIEESNISIQLKPLLEEYKPDILIITGHDAYYKKNNNKNDLNNYQNSKYFISAINVARKYEKSHEKLVIIAGACQSDYESLIKAGANFASSPKRINIHALDPAIIAASIALTEKNKVIDLVNILNKTKFGSDGIGGIMTSGLMYVGYPR